MRLSRLKLRGILKNRFKITLQCFINDRKLTILIFLLIDFDLFNVFTINRVVTERQSLKIDDDDDDSDVDISVFPCMN